MPTPPHPQYFIYFYSFSQHLISSLLISFFPCLPKSQSPIPQTLLRHSLYFHSVLQHPTSCTIHTLISTCVTACQSPPTTFHSNSSPSFKSLCLLQPTCHLKCPTNTLSPLPYPTLSLPLFWTPYILPTYFHVCTFLQL